MPTYIEREAFIEDIKTEIVNLYLDGMKGTPRGNEELYQIIDRINEQPAADVVERKRGEWETVGDGITERVRCSNCKSTEGSFGKPPFCNQCGADMRGEKHEAD